MTDAAPSGSAGRSGRAKQVVWFVVGLLIVVAIFVFAIPRFADWSAVWAAMKTLTFVEFWSLMAAMIFNLYTYWLANKAALPGLGLRRSAVVTQTGTSVANTMPAGGAVAVGMTYAILHSWGFTGGETALFVGVTGIWNNFVKLALPVVALGLLVATGNTNPALVTAAAVGLAVLMLAIVLLALVFRSSAPGAEGGRGPGARRLMAQAPVPQAPGHGPRRPGGEVPSRDDRPRRAAVVQAHVDHGAQPGRAVLRAVALAPPHGRERAGRC